MKKKFVSPEIEITVFENEDTLADISAGTFGIGGGNTNTRRIFLRNYEDA